MVRTAARLSCIVLLALPLLSRQAGQGRAFAQETAAPAQAVDYEQQVAPVLRKYCVGCHGADAPEGGLSLESYALLLKGGQRGAAVTPGRADQSRLLRVLTGAAEPRMPPEGEAAPTPEEIASLRAWIDSGAKGPSGAEPDPYVLATPRIEPMTETPEAVSSLAVSPQGDLAAVARGTHVELYPLDAQGTIAETPRATLAGHSGPVNAVSFSTDGAVLVAAAGEPGLFGEIRLWSVADGSLIKSLRGHRDSLYAARLSPDGSLLATAGYDRDVLLWNAATGEKSLTLEGHNGAVFDLAFRPDGAVLATASADRTVKLWSVATGQRLDTLGQSLQELYTLAFSPDGSRLAAAGVDNRIRVWAISPTAQEGANPLIYSIFAHESPVLRIAYTPDGALLASSGQDRLVKAWNASTMELIGELSPQPDWPTALAAAGDNRHVLVGLVNGETATLPLPTATAGEKIFSPLPETPPLVRYENQPPLDQLPVVAEAEPNDDPAAATPLAAPAVATGVIAAGQAAADVDCFRFTAKAGDQWIVEVDAARSGSPLDSHIEVLTAGGERITRMLLRAVRDSEVTFRGVDSSSLDCRVTNWEEMQLNQFLYLNGEVVKLYRAPQGPDSGFQFYPGSGARFGYFDTSALAHPVGQPCYIVTPYPADAVFPNNGLPAFPLYFENDDESRRQLGKDSRLTFTAPADGDYVVKVRDVRQEQGEKHSYKLIVRRPQPDFKVTLSGENPTINAGGGKRIVLKAERIDNFNGEIRVDFAGLPPGFHVSGPVLIQEGHIEARAVLWADADAPPPAAESAASISVTASAVIFGEEVVKTVNSLGAIKLEPKAKLVVSLLPSESSPGETSASDTAASEPPAPEAKEGQPAYPAVVIAPGQTVTCRLKIERNGFDDRVQFDVDNLPHGVIVDNIGLNGVLVPEGQTERTVYLTAAPWVGETSRLFHAVAQAEGSQASLPLMLHVRRDGKLAGP